jgi:hypothetical protein
VVNLWLGTRPVDRLRQPGERSSGTLADSSPSRWVAGVNPTAPLGLSSMMKQCSVF